MKKQIFFIILLFTFLFFINNIESKNNSVLGNCEKNQTAKYKKISSSKYSNEETKEIATNELSKEELDKHEMFMKIALEIAIKSKVKFVSIIVSPDDRVLCSGIFSKENAILHSELVAITNCSSSHKMVTFENHTIYSTAEPDSLSSSAVVWARFKQVVYGSSIKHLYCNACFSSLPIDSTFIFSRGYGIGVENIRLIAGVLQDQTDANFGSYCNSSISSVYKTNPQCKCKNPKLSKENTYNNNGDDNKNHRPSGQNDEDIFVIDPDTKYERRQHRHTTDSIDNFFDEIKSHDDDDNDFDKRIESNKQAEKSKNKEKKKHHSHHHSHTSKDGRSRTSTSTSTSGNGHATASASASSSSSSSTSFSHSSSSNDHHHKKDKSNKNKDNKEKGDKKDKKDKKEKKDKKKDKKDKSTSVEEEEINTLKVEKNSF
ncbi:hypothetical protein ACTFIY_007007 [Dictyostelium cf. discoideum]